MHFFLLRSETDLDVLTRNVKIISEGVARHLYGLTCEVYNEIMLLDVYLLGGMRQRSQ